MLSAESYLGANVKPTPTAFDTKMSARIKQDRDMIMGFERRLEREEATGKDLTTARLVVAKHYAAYATEMVENAGGDVSGMKTLTDKNNMAPLRWSDGTCLNID